MRRSEYRQQEKKAFPWVKVLLSLILIITLLIAGIFLYLFLKVKSTADTMTDEETVNYTSEKREKKVDLKKKEPISVVLFGTDSDAVRESKGSGARTDTIIVATINPNKDKTTMVSIPRDTQAKLADVGSVEKINHAYAYGGPTTAMKTVENLLDIPIDFYATVNMDGFTTVIDKIGGIDVTSPNTFSMGGYSFVEGETYHMDGKEALAFSRSRKQAGSGGDFGRQNRQQLVVESIMKNLVSINSASNINGILDTFGSNVITNASFNDLTKLQSYGGALDNIERDALEGSGGIQGDGLWYFVPSQQSINNVSNKARENLEL